MTALGWSGYYVYRYYATGHFSYNTLDEFLQSDQVGVNLVIGTLLWMLFHALSGYYARPYYKSHVAEVMTTLSTILLGGLIFFFAMVIDDIPFIDDEKLGAFRMLRVPPSYYMKSLLAMWSMMFVPVIIGRWILTSHVRKLHPDPMEGAWIQEDTTDADSNYRFIYSHLSDLRPIFVKPTSEDLQRGAIRTHSVTVRPMMVYGPLQPLSDFRIVVKRTTDILFSLLALVILSPVFLLLAVLIKCDSSGPVFYSQERIGLCRKPFRLWKFRSMQTCAEKEGPVLSSDNDPRATRIGRVMRKYRLDELPQFWNILRGDMSLVGPRPERQYFIDLIMERQPVYTRLLQLRPGLTSWGMVKFGYAQSIDQMLERMQYDLIYIDNCTFAMDLKIMAYTVKTVVTGKGV